MSVRNRNPDPHPLAEALRVPDTDDAEDVLSIVGFVGPRDDPGGPVRLFADPECQRYLDIPFDEFIHADEVPYDELGRTQIYVKRAFMAQDLFAQRDGASVQQAIEDAIVGLGMSTWQFLPQNRIVAAGMMGMLPEEERRRYEEEVTT